MSTLIEQYKALRKADAPPDSFVFHSGGQPLDERSVLRYELRPVVKALGLYFEGFGWHTFRRTHLTVLSEEGATAFETRDQAGHAKVETTMLYVKPRWCAAALRSKGWPRGSFPQIVRELCGKNGLAPPTWTLIYPAF
jgi:integrase